MSKTSEVLMIPTTSRNRPVVQADLCDFDYFGGQIVER
jgi:hypothetical protein